MNCDNTVYRQMHYAVDEVFPWKILAQFKSFMLKVENSETFSNFWQ